MDGTGGSYFLMDSHNQRIAVFKPLDEEAQAPKNPRGFTGKMNGNSLRAGIESGTCGYREVNIF